MRTAVILRQDQMGSGDAELGRKILATFLRKALALRELSTVVLYNSAVKLAVAGSPVLTELRQLHDAGVEILPCGTCLDHFGLRENVAVAQAADMDAIIAELGRAEKIITL